MHDHKARQKVAQFRRLGSIGGGVVVDSLGAANFVDADNQRLQVRVAGLRAKVQHHERRGEQNRQHQSDLEIPIQQQGSPVELHELAFGVLGGLYVEVGNHCSHRNLQVLKKPC